MILIRIAYSASLPTPLEILNDVKKKSELAPTIAVASRPAQAQPAVVPSAKQAETVSEGKGLTFNTPEELAAYLESAKKVLMAYTFKHDISFSEFAQGKMKITASDKINNDFLLNLQNILIEATGSKWDIEVLRGHLGETIADKEEAADNANKKSVSDLPLVKAILAEFKGAKIETLMRKISSTDEDESEEAASSFNSYEDNDNYFDEDL